MEFDVNQTSFSPILITSHTIAWIDGKETNGLNVKNHYFFTGSTP